MNLYAETEVFQACRILFGNELRVNRDFLRYLQPTGAKKAYRQRALETHPDRYGHATPTGYCQQVKRFQDLNQAYQLILEFLSHRQDQDLPLRGGVAAGPPPHTSQRPSSTWTGPRSERGTDPRYHGPIPQRPLEFGMYLYYRGIIPFRTLIAALSWQRRQRPNLGDIAIRWGWLRQEQVERICRYRPANAYYRRFGERAVELKLLQPHQLQTLLYYQRSLQRRLGEYFREQGLLSERQLQSLLTEHKLHNQRFARH